jgi:hypothetical protein
MTTPELETAIRVVMQTSPLACKMTILCAENAVKAALTHLRDHPTEKQIATVRKTLKGRDYDTNERATDALSAYWGSIL